MSLTNVNNRLVEMSFSELPNLQDHYKNNLEKYFVTYQTIENYIQWYKKEPEIKKDIKIYSLNGDWSDGTFLIVDRRNVCFSTFNENSDRLLQALHLLDKSKSFQFYGFPHRLLLTIEDQMGISWPSIEGVNGTATILYKINKEIAKNFVVIPPLGVVIKPLVEENAQTINDLWPHRYSGSERFLTRIIHYNLSLGAFKEDTEEIMAWCLMLPIRSLGALQVRDKFKRQGLGSLLVKKMSKILADLNEDIIAPVVVKNVASRSMFEKIGFKEIDKIYWIESIASNPNFKWPENEDRRNVFFSTVDENSDRLLSALNLLDKSKSFLFFGFPSRFLPTIEKFNGKTWASMEGDIGTATILYEIKKEVAKNFEINPPPEIVLKQLIKDNVKTINEIWPHRYPGSERFLGRLIHYNMSLGAFKEDTDEIMAWCLILPIRGLGALHVKEEYKRQGLGSLLVRAISKKFADQNEDTIAPVVVQNIPSRTMFEKIGFKQIDKIYWIESIANDPNFIWPEDEI